MYTVTLNKKLDVVFSFSIDAIEFAASAVRRGNRATFKFTPSLTNR